MTDNRTTELRVKLTERGIEYTTNDHMGVCETSWNGFTAMQLTPGAKLMMAFTPEQAIATTLGAQTAGVAEKVEELRKTSLAFPPNIRRKVNMALSEIEQAIDEPDTIRNELTNSGLLDC